MKKPKVSIITVCYNSEKTIEKTINSVLKQTYANIEYIIIDGQSTDRTLDIVQGYMPLFEGRLKLISEPDTGIYNAMNKGIKQAVGNIIGIVNSDDYYEFDAVEKIINAWDGNGMQVLYGLMRKLKNGKEDSVMLFTHETLEKRMILHPSCFVTTDVYENIGLFDEKYKSVADYDFMLRAYESGCVKFVPVYSIISNFSDGGMSETMEGYMEGLKYLHDRGKLSYTTYLIAKIYEPIKRKLTRLLWK